MSGALPLANAARRLRGAPGRPKLSNDDRAQHAKRAALRAAARAAFLASVHPRLLDLRAAARYVGLSPWTMRTLLNNGTLPRVIVRSPSGKEVRKLLVDRGDLDRLIDAWKETPR